MRDQGWISQDEYDNVLQDDVYSRIQVVDNNTNDNAVNSYFVDALTDEILADLMKKGYSETQAYTLLYSGGLRKGNNMQAVFSDSAVPGNDTAPAAADENSAERLAPDDAMDGAVPSDREAQQKSDAGKDMTGGCPDGENLYTAAPARTMDAALAHAAEALDQQGFVLTVAAREGSAVQVLLTDAAGGIGDPAVLDAAMEAEGFTAADNNWYTYEEDTNS